MAHFYGLWRCTHTHGTRRIEKKFVRVIVIVLRKKKEKAHGYIEDSCRRKKIIFP